MQASKRRLAVGSGSSLIVLPPVSYRHHPKRADSKCAERPNKGPCPGGQPLWNWLRQPCGYPDDCSNSTAKENVQPTVCLISD